MSFSKYIQLFISVFIIFLTACEVDNNWEKIEADYNPELIVFGLISLDPEIDSFVKVYRTLELSEESEIVINNDTIESDGNIYIFSNYEPAGLIKNAEGDTASLISKSDKELTISKEELDKKYEPIFILFENLAVLRRNALGISIGKDGEGTKEEELGSLEDYLNTYKELMGGVSDFISAEYDRQMAIEQNKTNVSISYRTIISTLPKSVSPAKYGRYAAVLSVAMYFAYAR